MLVVVDIDLTLADCSKRIKKAGNPPARSDSKEFEKWLKKLQQPKDMLKDPAVPGMYELVNSIRGQLSPVRLVYLTSRERSYYDVTKEWLDRNGFLEGPVIMRETGDPATYHGFKEEVLKRLSKEANGHNIIVFDDHPEMSEVCQRHGWVHLMPRFKTKAKFSAASAWGGKPDSIAFEKLGVTIGLILGSIVTYLLGVL